MNIQLDKLSKMNGYYVGTIEAVDEQTASVASEYKKNVCKNFVSINPEQIEARVGGEEFYLTRKYDGEMAVIFFNGKDTFIINTGGKVRMGLPCTEEAGKVLKSAGIKSAIIPAELYLSESEGRTRVFDTLSALSKEEEIHKLRLAPFDIIQIDDEPFKGKNYLDTYNKLELIFGKSDMAGQVVCQKVSSKSEIIDVFRQWVDEDGAEGIVLRTDLPLVYKIKPKHTVDVVVVGYSEGSGEAKGKLRTLLVAVINSENKYQVVGKTGNGFNEDQKKELIEKLSKLTIESDYIQTDSNHVAFRMVKPEIVIEISCNDVLFETSTTYVTNPILEIEDGKAKLVGSCKGISFIYPIFIRERVDKKADIINAGIDQITKNFYVPDFGCSESNVELPKSEVLFREVYKKESKGKLMIQKFVIWKTNKHSVNNNYPEYVMHYTNFSSDRKDPLQRDIRVSNSNDQITEITKLFIETNVKKGWVKVC